MSQTAKDRIAQTLVELLAKKGADADIPVKELISRSGVNRSTYYYHFRKVEDVVEYLMDQFVGEYERVLTSYGSAQVNHDSGVLVEGTESITRFIYDRRDTFSALLGSSYRDLLRYRLVRATRKAFEEYEWFYLDVTGMPTRLTHIEKQYYSYYSGYAFYSFIECWAKRNFQESPEEIVRLNSRLMTLDLTAFEHVGW